MGTYKTRVDMCINLWVSRASRQASAEYLFCSTKCAFPDGESVGNFGLKVDVESSIGWKGGIVSGFGRIGGLY